MSAPEVLGALGESLGVGGGPMAFFRAVARAGEPYELGVALTLDGDAALVSYNPRRRGGGARARMLAALAERGVDPAPAAAAFARIPEDRCSTVLGLEWRAGEPAPSATLYLEELARRAPPRAVARWMRELAALAGVALTGEAGRPGPVYILALDLGPESVGALKIYREAGPEHAAAVRADLAGFLGCAPAPSPLFGGAETSGYIVQRRYAAGRPAAHKIYKCYPYLRGGAELAPARAEIRAAMAIPPPAWLAAAPPTSLGLRFLPGDSEPIGGTAYWCVALNRSPI